MASLPLVNPLAGKSSANQHSSGLSNGLALEEPKRGPTATRRSRSEQPSPPSVADPNISPPVKLSPAHRQRRRRGGLRGGSGGQYRLPAIKRFFTEDETLHGGYIPNYRYLPILSGLIIPFAILLEIPGLTSHWYIRTEGFVIVEYQTNPPILYAAMATSIALAVIANICLIVRFLERRIYSMTVAAIVCLFVHDIINISVVTTFGVIHRFDDGFTYSQAFWMTVCSTIASVTTTITLLFDYFLTPNFANSGSGLTRKQRSSVIVFMVLLADLAIGALIYCYLLNLEYLDTLYFAVVSSFTIGFGDIVPTTSGSKVFSVFYNTIGILNTGLFIAVARSTIVESFEQSYRRRRHLMRERRRLHQQETARAKRESGNLQLAAIAQAIALTQAATGITTNDGAAVRADASGSKVAAEREAAAYTKFREEMAREEKKEFRAKLWVALGLFIAVWLIGSAIFMATEQWGFGTAVYFCFVAFSTIGYGDLTPQSPAGRAVFVFWAIASVAAMTVLISVLAEAYLSRYSMIVKHDLLDKQIEGLREKSSLSRRNTDVDDERDHRRRFTRDTDGLAIDERIEALEGIRQELTGLPELIIQDARDFQVHIRYIGDSSQSHGDKLPPGLERVLQEAMDHENMSEAMRTKALQDDGAKKALMMLHLENTVQRLVNNAERLTDLLAERDALEREGRQEDSAEIGEEFDEELVEADSPVEIEVEEEGERRTRDEEAGIQWTMDDNRLHTRPRGLPSRSISQSPRRRDEPR